MVRPAFVYSFAELAICFLEPFGVDPFQQPGVGIFPVILHAVDEEEREYFDALVLQLPFLFKMGFDSFFNLFFNDILPGPALFLPGSHSDTIGKFDKFPARAGR